MFGHIFINQHDFDYDHTFLFLFISRPHYAFTAPATSDLWCHHPEQAEENAPHTLCVCLCSAYIYRNLQTAGPVAPSMESTISCSWARAELTPAHGTVKLGKNGRLGIKKQTSAQQ